MRSNSPDVFRISVTGGHFLFSVCCRCSFTIFAFCILELCCLDSMFLVSITVFAIASIPCCFLCYLRYLNSAFLMLILKLCCLDSMFLVFFTLFEFCVSHSGIMLPRFHKVNEVSRLFWTVSLRISR